MSACLFICFCLSFHSSMGHLVSSYMEDMFLFYASVLRHPNQHIRFCLIVYASILVFQLGREGSTTSSRVPLGQHLKNPKKEAHLKNPTNRCTVDTTSRAQEAWNYNASTFMKLRSCHSVLINTYFVTPVFGLQCFVLAVHADIFFLR